MSTTQKVSLDLILCCGICGKSLSNVYAEDCAELAAKSTLETEAGKIEEAEVKFYLLGCGHLTCRTHLRLGPRHSGQTGSSRAVCPVCQSQPGGDTAPEEDLHYIVNPISGAYHSRIPRQLFSLPTFDVEHPVPGMEGPSIKFQYQTLVRNLQVAHARLATLTRENEHLRKNTAIEKLYGDRMKDRLNDVMKENAELLEQVKGMEDWREKEGAIRHYLGIVQPLSDENSLLRARLRDLGEEVPSMQYALNISHDGRTLQDLQPSSDTVGHPSPRLPETVDPNLGSGDRSGAPRALKRVLCELEKGNLEIRLATSSSRKGRQHSRERMPPPRLPLPKTPSKYTIPNDGDFLADMAWYYQRSFVDSMPMASKDRDKAQAKVNLIWKESGRKPETWQPVRPGIRAIGKVIASECRRLPAPFAAAKSASASREGLTEDQVELCDWTGRQSPASSETLSPGQRAPCDGYTVQNAMLHQGSRPFHPRVSRLTSLGITSARRESPDSVNVVPEESVTSPFFKASASKRAAGPTSQRDDAGESRTGKRQKIRALLPRVNGKEDVSNNNAASTQKVVKDMHLHKHPKSTMGRRLLPRPVDSTLDSPTATYSTAGPPRAHQQVPGLLFGNRPSEQPVGPPTHPLEPRFVVGTNTSVNLTGSEHVSSSHNLQQSPVNGKKWSLTEFLRSNEKATDLKKTFDGATYGDKT